MQLSTAFIWLSFSIQNNSCRYNEKASIRTGFASEVHIVRCKVGKEMYFSKIFKLKEISKVSSSPQEICTLAIKT